MKKIYEMIEAVGTKDLQKIKEIWNYFDSSVYFPDHIHPYKELGVLVCRGKVMKKAHNCVTFQSIVSRGDYDLWFKYQNNCLLVHYRNSELCYMMYYIYDDNNDTIIGHFGIYYDESANELKIGANLNLTL